MIVTTIADVVHLHADRILLPGELAPGLVLQYCDRDSNSVNWCSAGFGVVVPRVDCGIQKTDNRIHASTAIGFLNDAEEFSVVYWSYIVPYQSLSLSIRDRSADEYVPDRVDVRIRFAHSAVSNRRRSVRQKPSSSLLLLPVLSCALVVLPSD